ncbi:Mitochondrial coenzyme A transporter SLC25A42 [Hypsibius exemplaris]|uniref:Mitochondrial coenzyme A transporter SLC25A42 n=1 Tax=Hypsibius exemplaris TaxID=2072580 RepID=A0A1W0XAT8_HYPEX|nr:Mitochondrial coenzyme A transporter SLC25A42 [Hypsibius exemplaris]
MKKSSEVDLGAGPLALLSQNAAISAQTASLVTLTPLSSATRIWTSLVAGATAGALAKTSIAPLDRTKINFQTSHDKFTLRDGARYLTERYRHEGFLSLWRGNSATMVRVIPYAAIQFASHEQWKHVLMVEDIRTVSPGRRFLAGSLAGVTASTLTYPLDLARARMAVTEKSRYSSLRDVFRHLLKEEGWLALYRGFSPTILGVIPYAGASFFTFETLKRRHLEYCKRPARAYEKMFFGACAGAVGQTSSYPFDIVRRRMQTAADLNFPRLGVWAALKKIALEEGIRGGLFKGLTLNWVKGPIAVGVSFTTFDLVQTLLRRLHRESKTVPK